MKPPTRKSCPPALAPTKCPLFRSSAIPMLLIGAATIGGCAQKLVPPDISYDDIAPAVQMGDPPAPVMPRVRTQVHHGGNRSAGRRQAQWSH